jgi:hypothetical protein
MPAQIACPSCRQPLRVPEELLGRDVKCPKCETKFVARDDADAPPEPPRPSPHEDETIREDRESPRSRPRAEDETPRRARPRFDETDDAYDDCRPRRSFDDADDAYDDRRPRRRDYDDEDDYPVRRRRRFDSAPHRGPMILTFGILSLAGLVICGPLMLLGIPACIMGMIDLKAMREGRMDPDGRATTMTGFVMGIISTALLVLSVLAIIVLIALGP